MRGLIRRRLHGSEDGVTMVIVALCLIALFGMLVLVVDVGGLLWNRREMVNAADAAALSAAQTCALSAAKDPRTPEQAADQLAQQNSTKAQTAPTNIVQPSTLADCHTKASGWVTARYSSSQHLFFAPVLGAAANGQVTTQATAIWGPAGTANPVPLAIYTSSFAANCDIQTLPTGTNCYFWFDNTNFGSSRFGILDLRPWNGTNQSGWNAPGNAQSCGSGVGASQLSQWIAGAGVEDLPTNYPAATYVCIISGTPEKQVWDSLKSRVNDVLTFPINRCEIGPGLTPGIGQISLSSTDPRGFTEVPCSTAPNKYDIIGFVDFRLTGVFTSQQEWGGTSLTSCQSNNFHVLHGGSYSLLDLGGNCPPSTSLPTGIKNLLIGGKAPTDPTPQYTVDDATNPRTFTWTGPDGNVDIKYDWWRDGQCGQPPPNSSAVCIKVQTVEVRVGGGGAGNGSPLSNVRAVKLCEPSIPGSCAPYNVPNVP